jgi:hypothetical protein
MDILLVPFSKKTLKKIDACISKMKCPPPKQKVPPLNRGVITLGDRPSQYTRKFVPGFYKYVMFFCMLFSSNELEAQAKL